jgi:DHA2 family multidrug resistance protein-like MFS transporter
MDDTTRTESGPLAGRREWIGLAVLALPTLLLSLDISVLYLALPHLSAQLGADSVEQLWIMDIYTFMLAGFLITLGTLGDRIGRRKLLLVGAALFGIASAFAAYSTTTEMLIIARAVMGISGATLMPSTLALISNMFLNTKQRGVAIGVWASCMMVGAAIGPIVGGLLLESFWWGSVFLMGVPVMVLLLIAGPILLPEYKDENAGRLDLLSVVLSLAAILPVIYGLKDAAKDGIGLTSIVAVVVGVLFGIVFARRQLRLEHPLLDLRLFKIRSFSAALAIIILGGIPLAGIFLLVSQHMQMVLSMSPTATGLWLAPVGLVIAIGASISPGIAQKVRPGYVVAVGMIGSIIGFVMLTQIDSASGLAMIVIGMILVYMGVGPSMALGVDMVVGSAPPEKAGSASATSETSTELGSALGIALLGSLATAVYRSNVTVPEQITGAQAQEAQDNIAGAVTVAEQAPEGAGAQLLDSANEAFSTAVNAGAIVGVVLFTACAVIAATMLRHVPPSGQAEQAEKQDALTQADGRQ